MSRFDHPNLVVVKVGSSSLRAVDGRLDRAQVHALAEQVVHLRQSGTRVVLVSSGAVSAGMGLLGLDERPTELPALQAAAAVGQGELVHEYQQTFRAHGIAAAQILLTAEDFGVRERYLNARTTLGRLLDLDAVPIINENDAVATEELAYGDNDHLAALVTAMLHADLLVLLSDVDGLYDGDPGREGVTLVPRIDQADEVDLHSVGGTGSRVGSGGMRTKVEAAMIATASTADVVVANARHPSVLAEAVSGADVGSWFVASDRRVEARKLWIGYANPVHGRVAIDAGARKALVEGGRSLLAVGVQAVDGEFVAGDAISVTAEGAEIARGLVAYGSDDCRRLAGRNTEQALAELGPAYGRPLVHRDDLTLLQ